MIRLLMIATALAVVITAVTAIRLNPHLWVQGISLLDHQARGAGTDLNARLGTWITPGPDRTP